MAKKNHTGVARPNSLVVPLLPIVQSCPVLRLQFLPDALAGIRASGCAVRGATPPLTEPSAKCVAQRVNVDAPPVFVLLLETPATKSRLRIRSSTSSGTLNSGSLLSCSPGSSSKSRRTSPKQAIARRAATSCFRRWSRTLPMPAPRILLTVRQYFPGTAQKTANLSPTMRSATP